MDIQFVFEPDSPERLRDLGLLAESLGFGAVWLPNILSARDPFLALSLLARASRRIRLGPVAISPFELHPAKIASSLLCLNELARGRASLVLGGGGGTMIALGLKPDRGSTAPRMLRGVREGLEILRGATGGGPVNHHGELFRVNDYRPSWAGERPPLLYVAASKPRMLQLAGQLADGVMFSDVMPEDLPAALRSLDTGLAASGRARKHFRVNNLVAWHVKPSREEAYREARTRLWVRGIWDPARLAHCLPEDEIALVMARLPQLAAAYSMGRDPADLLPDAVLDRMVDGLTLTGAVRDIDRLSERLLAFVSAGIGELSLRLYGEPGDALRRVAERVQPALRQART
ncbi:MAG: LLM class flavin-dependent oxidoreductase [Chromatiales bacterium]|nr:LLM class flavin-dependent oxidoreductase [Chromatiales bacterium]